MIIKKSVFDTASRETFGRLISLGSPSEMRPISGPEMARLIAFIQRTMNGFDQEFASFEERAINKETNYLNRYQYLLPFLNKVKEERERYKAFDLSCYRYIIESPQPVFFKCFGSDGYVFTELFCGTKRVGDNCYEYATKGVFHLNGNSPYFLEPGFATGIKPYDQKSFLDAIRMDLAAFGVGMRFLPDYNPATYRPTAGKTLCYGVYGYDYHFYRLDNQHGFWTHKPGSTPVTCFDDRGDLITNPATCAKMAKVYTHEIGFFEIDLP